MNLWILFLVSLTHILSFHTGRCEIDPITQESIDDIFETFLPWNNIPGLGLSIVKDGQTLYTQGYGHRNVEDSIPADNNTLFLIGSISKSFTATLVVKTLSDKFPLLGEFVLDTPIADLSPNYNFTLSDRFRSEKTTFRDLLSHLECLMPESLGTVFGAVETVEELVYRQRYAGEICQFRTNYVYNNGLYALAGEVIAEIAGVPYLDMLSTFFNDLGMTDTDFLRATDDHDNMSDRARGYCFRNGQLGRFNSELYKRYIPLNAAGGIISSPVDMAKYIQFHLNRGRIGDVQLISEEAMKWFEKISNPFLYFGEWKQSSNDRLDLSMGYSLALIVGTYDGYLRIAHDGYLPPFNSYMSLYPALNLGIFSTSNGPGPVGINSTHGQLHSAIFDILQAKDGTHSMGLKAGRQLPELAKTPRQLFTKPLIQNRTPFMHSMASSSYEMSMKNIPSQAENITGHYGNPLSGEFDVSEKLNSNGQMELYLNYGTFGQGWLRQLLNGTYLLQWEVDFLDDFYAAGEEPPVLSFVSEGTQLIMYSNVDPGPIEVYFKDQVLANLPDRPWSPGSCGPETSS